MRRGFIHQIFGVGIATNMAIVTNFCQAQRNLMPMVPPQGHFQNHPSLRTAHQLP